MPVLIVGGGGAGLTASMLLARLGVEHLLVSARPGTSDLPKAHVLNQRAMEVLEDCAVADAVAERSTPADQMAATAYYTGFAGPAEEYGRKIARLESWGAGGDNDNWRAASPWHQLNLPQIRLEPILKAGAERLSPGRIRFNHELVELEQDEDGVTARVRDNGGGEEYVVRCDYLLGADGGRRCAGLLGVTYEGLGVVTQTATLHVSADFSRWARDADVLIRWIASPQAPTLIVMVPMRPERWSPDSEEWVIHFNYPADDPRAQSDEQVEADVRDAIGIPSLPMKIHKITRWSVDAVIASAFRVGRVFLLGDAAHRHPPTGGLGLTSAIHDAQNLCWKLAAVLAGTASPELLDSYEPERRSSDERNAQRSLENAVNQFAIMNALGISPENTGEENWAQLRRMWSGLPEDAEHRAAVLRAIRMQSMEFNELNVEFGYTYDSAAVVPDGTPAPQPADDIRVYEPTTTPGAPLPHAWIDANRRPIKDLVAPGRFLLIAGEDGAAWCEAAERLAADAGVPLDAVRSVTSTVTCTTRAACGCATVGSAATERCSSVRTASSAGVAWPRRSSPSRSLPTTSSRATCGSRRPGFEPAFCIDHGMTFSYYYADPEGNHVELQVDNFGDWSKSTKWMRTSEEFKANPIGVFVDPDRVAADHADGLPFEEIHAKAMTGGYAPEQAPVEIPEAS